MSAARNERRAPELITGFRSFTPGTDASDWHDHREGQLLWSPAGPFYEHTMTGLWVVPVASLVWIPPGMLHRGGPDSMHSLYLDPAVCADLPTHSCLVALTPALSDALHTTLDAIEAEQRTEPLLPRLLAELRDSGLAPLADPFPYWAERSFLVRVADRERGVARTLAEWSALSEQPASALTRALKDETGMTFPRWQRQIRLLDGLFGLAQGAPVSEAARRAGYRHASHFVATFQASLGTTPARYLAPLLEAAHGPARDSRAARARLLPASPAKRVTADPARAPVVAPRGADAKEGVRLAGPGDWSDVVRVRVVDHASGNHCHIHRHARGELNWPVEIYSVATDRGTWVGHDSLATWLPVGCEHESLIWGRVRSFLIRPEEAASLPDRPCAVAVTPQLRRALMDLVPSFETKPRAEATQTLLREARESALPALPLYMLRPVRTTPLVQALRRDPSIDWTAEHWAAELGMSRRTFLRACEAELGCSFGDLRRLMQVRRAVELMAVGETVQSSARRVGYAHVPKFIAMFHRIVGVTPGQYLKRSRGILPRAPIG